MSTIEVAELIIQGVLASLLVIGALTLAGLELWRGQAPSVPEWLTLSIGAVMGYFFGTRVKSGAPWSPPASLSQPSDNKNGG